YCYAAHPDLHSFPTRRSSDLMVPLRLGDLRDLGEEAHRIAKIAAAPALLDALRLLVGRPAVERLELLLRLLTRVRLHSAFAGLATASRELVERSFGHGLLSVRRR